MNKNKIANKIVMISSAAAALAVINTQTNWLKEKKMTMTSDRERCYGVAKKGHNDCGTHNHMCANMSIKDNDPNEWIMLPKGICKKLKGGQLNNEKPSS